MSVDDAARRIVEARRGVLETRRDAAIEELREQCREEVAKKKTYYAAAGVDLSGSPMVVINGMCAKFARKIEQVRELCRAEIAVEEASLESEPIGGAGNEHVTWDEIAADHVVVSRGQERWSIRGETCCRVFLLVASAPDGSTTWQEVQDAMRSHLWDRTTPIPRPPQTVDTLKHRGRDIRRSLGELGVYWEQYGGSVSWSPA